MAFALQSHRSQAQFWARTGLGLGLGLRLGLGLGLRLRLELGLGAGLVGGGKRQEAAGHRPEVGRRMAA